MHCKDGRALEITAVVNVAPGLLSGYTKIVRFLPRYVIVSDLPYPVRLWQDSSIFRPSLADNSAATPSKERKWRITRGQHRRSARKVNQYESLFGRETTLDERSVVNIPSGTRAHPSALYVTTIGQKEVIPFNLPDSRGERQLRLGLGGQWNLTASISADVPGEHTLKVSRAVDLKIIPHISTRASPEYEIVYRMHDVRTFGRELGVWFETEWGSDRNMIVKAVKKDSYAFQETDIHVGDELLNIDDFPVSRMTFSEAMNKLRTRLTEISESAAHVDPRISQRRGSLRLVGVGRAKPVSGTPPVAATPLKLTFRTVEERLRRVRLKAARANDFRTSLSAERCALEEQSTLRTISEDLSERQTEPGYIKAELKALQHSLFLVLQEEKSVPYQIQNRTSNHTMYYRQKGCDGHPWQSLKPGQSDDYCWEEPLKAKRLTVRVASYGSSLFETPASGQSDDPHCDTLDSKGRRRETGLSRLLLRKVKDEEEAVFSPSIIVRLEEIGFTGFLPCPKVGENQNVDASNLRYIELLVDVVGATRVLIVQDATRGDEADQIFQHLEYLREACESEKERKHELLQLDNALADYNIPIENIEANAMSLMKDFPEKPMISGCHKILIEVLEAKGLSPDTYVGSCNPYAEIKLKTSSSRRTFSFKKADLKRTYYVENTVNPTWINQSFVFDVTDEAVAAPRGHSIKVRMRNFRAFGYHKVLGGAHIELHSVRDQKQLVGWFPLAGRTGRHELENPLSHWGRGSVKLRVQWIHSVSALLRYFTQLSEKRLLELNGYLDGMAKQLDYKRETENKKREAMDGFKKVRVRDLVSASGQGKKLKPPPMMKGESDTADDLPQEMSVTSAGTASLDVAGGEKVRWSDNIEVGKSRRDSKRQVTSPNAVQDTRERLQSLILKKRQVFQNVQNLRGPSESKLQVVLRPGHSAAFPISSLRSLTSAKCLFRDADFVTLIEGDEVKVRLKNIGRKIESASEEETNSVLRKFNMPRTIPATIRIPARERGSALYTARNELERAARREIGSILHPGGWLIVRPFAALNLPDTYTGMFVRLRYGPDLLDTETVDARLSPTWNVPPLNRQRSTGVKQSIEYGSNDLHIHVAPQQTSSSIRLSVFGERSHRNLQAKTELGVVHLPLGATIAACMDSASETYSVNVNSSPSPLVYEKWFLLTDPKVAVPVEGDRGLSLRSPESEKDSDVLFNEYFAPSIHLALIWLPDTEDNSLDDDKPEDALTIVDRSASNSPASGSTMTTYLRADVGRISAALIDSQRAFELISLSTSDFLLRYWTTKAKTRVGMSIGWLQIDQQDDNAREPVILAPTPSDYIGPVIQMLAVKDNVRSAEGVLSFDFIDVSVAEFDITLEESMLFDLFDFISSVKLRRGFLVRAASAASGETVRAGIDGSSRLFPPERSSGVSVPLEMLLYRAHDAAKDKMVYIEQLFLGILKVNLSYLKGKKQTWELTSQGNWVIKRVDGSHGLQNLAGSSGQFAGSSPFHVDSEAMTRWSQHTSDDEFQSENSSK